MRMKILGSFLLTFLFVVPPVASQESRPPSAAPSRASKIDLPINEFAEPFNAKDAIVVTVSRALVPTQATTRPGRRLEEWRIEAGNREYALTKAGIAELQEYLLRLGKARPGKTETAPSERALLIRADAAATYGHIQQVLQAASGARIYWTYFAGVPKEGGSPGAFLVRLPRDVGQGKPGRPHSVKLFMTWDPSAKKIERDLEDRDTPPTHEGDQLLEKLLTDKQAEWTKQGVIAAVVFLGEPIVPWQSVVDVIAIARRSGAQKFEFGAGAPLER